MLVEVEGKLDETVRGEGGFGSTGVSSSQNLGQKRLKTEEK